MGATPDSAALILPASIGAAVLDDSPVRAVINFLGLAAREGQFTRDSCAGAEQIAIIQILSKRCVCAWWTDTVLVGISPVATSFS